MPSCTVPMFSNSAETSHMIHCDMPQSLQHQADDHSDRADRHRIAEPQPDRQRADREEQQRVEHVEDAERPVTSRIER